MNKKAKIAMAAASVVMAGTMALGIVGCTTPNPGPGGPGGTDDSVSAAATNFVARMNDQYNLADRVATNASAYARAASYWNILKPTGGTVTAPTAGPDKTYTANTQIGIAIGNNDLRTGAFYNSGIDGSVTVPGGYSATKDVIKPAFAAIQDALNFEFKDEYAGKGTGENLAAYMPTTGNSKWGNGVDICTANLTNAVDAANANPDNILNLGAYLDQMPNFKYFLETNPIVYLSLIQEGLQANKSGLGLYCAPYFDGNDDIERYCLMRQDWVETLLDGTLENDGDKFQEACGTDSVHCTSFMGKTGNYTVETTNANGTGTFTLKKDYDAAKTAVTTDGTALNTAYKAIAGANASYTENSGNIVDIMNDAISKNLDANGKQLVALYKAYIGVAYKNGNNAAYTKLSEVFNGYNAAWDVDDLVAILRIVKTNSVNLGLAAKSTEGIFPRDATNDRTPDIIRLVAQLYGERGADSRYENSYIGADGTLKDMRSNASFYDALTNFGNMAKEGLVVDYVNGSLSAGDLKGNCDDKPGKGFMMYDYSQTQTTQMYDKAAGSKYIFGAVNTPVSRWDTDATAGKETVMRFTESWRSTKTSGLVVAGAVANDANKLKAVLAFIDYLYSNDGQIVSTFGIQSTNGDNNANGTWYGTKIDTDAKVAAIVSGQTIASVTETRGGQKVVKDAYKKYFFTFKDELYTGYDYLGQQTPKITTELYNAFMQKVGEGDIGKNFDSRGNFTNFARRVVGSTLPMGIKSQSFETQLTAPDAAACATKVSVSLANGTIKHVVLNPGTNPWYTAVPTALPFTTTETNNNGSSDQTVLKKISGGFASKSACHSIFHHIIFNGFTGTYNQDGVTVVFG